MQFLASHKKIFIAIFILLFVYGAFLRFYRIGETSLWIDESYTINGSLAVLEHGYPLLDSDRLYRSGLLYVYADALMIKLFGLEPFSPDAMRIPAAIAGIATAFISILFLRKVFHDEPVIWMAAGFILLFSEWLIGWSRQARGYTFLCFFLALSFYLLVLYREKKRRGLLVGVVASLGLGALSHGVGMVFFPICLILILYLMPREVVSNKVLAFVKNRPVSSLTAASIILSFSALLITDFGPYILPYKRFLTSNLPLSIFIWGGIFGALLSFFDSKRKNKLVFLTVPFVTGFFVVIFFGWKGQARYLFPLMIFAVPLFAYMFIRLSEFVFRGRQAGIFIGCTILLFAFPGLSFAPRGFYPLEVGSPQPDFKKAYAFIRDNMKEGDVVVSSFTALHNIYLGQKGAWLAISLNNNYDDVAYRTVNGKDYYQGSPALSTIEELNRYLDEHSGFIIFDGVSFPRPPAFYDEVLARRDTEKVLELRGPAISNLWIFRF